MNDSHLHNQLAELRMILGLFGQVADMKKRMEDPEFAETGRNLSNSLAELEESLPFLSLENQKATLKEIEAPLSLFSGLLPFFANEELRTFLEAFLPEGVFKQLLESGPVLDRIRKKLLILLEKEPVDEYSQEYIDFIHSLAEDAEGEEKGKTGNSLRDSLGL